MRDDGVRERAGFHPPSKTQPPAYGPLHRRCLGNIQWMFLVMDLDVTAPMSNEYLHPMTEGPGEAGCEAKVVPECECIHSSPWGFPYNDSSSYLCLLFKCVAHLHSRSSSVISATYFHMIQKKRKGGKKEGRVRGGGWGGRDEKKKRRRRERKKESKCHHWQLAARYMDNHCTFFSIFSCSLESFQNKMFRKSTQKSLRCFASLKIKWMAE